MSLGMVIAIADHIHAVPELLLFVLVDGWALMVRLPVVSDLEICWIRITSSASTQQALSYWRG
jgi:hypothetical protein